MPTRSPPTLAHPLGRALKGRARAGPAPAGREQRPGRAGPGSAAPGLTSCSDSGTAAGTMGRFPPRCSRSRSRSLSLPFSASPFSAWVMLRPGGSRVWGARAAPSPARGGSGRALARHRPSGRYRRRSAAPRRCPGWPRSQRSAGLLPRCSGARQRLGEPGEQPRQQTLSAGLCCWGGCRSGTRPSNSLKFCSAQRLPVVLLVYVAQL